MDQAAVIQAITESFDDVQLTHAFDATFFFYGPDRMFPFATIVDRDEDYDKASHLDRPSAFRLNLGVGRPTYTRLMGASPPKGLGEDNVAQTGHDYTALDTLMPHPLYAPQSWISIISPSRETFEEVVRPLLEEAHARAVRRLSAPGSEQED